MNLFWFYTNIFKHNSQLVGDILHCSEHNLSNLAAAVVSEFLKEVSDVFEEYQYILRAL